MSEGATKRFFSPRDATERILASGRPLGAGEHFELTSEDLDDDFNKRLIAEGHIVEYTEPTATEVKAHKKRMAEADEEGKETNA